MLICFNIVFSFLDDILFLIYIKMSHFSFLPWTYKVIMGSSVYIYVSIVWLIVMLFIENNSNILVNITYAFIGWLSICEHSAWRAFKEDRKINFWKEYFYKLQNYRSTDTHYELIILWTIYYIITLFFPNILNLTFLKDLFTNFQWMYEINYIIPILIAIYLIFFTIYHYLIAISLKIEHHEWDTSK